VFADAGGYCPDFRAISWVASSFRRLILSGYGGSQAPEIICGHTAEGITLKPHMAILPMADVGWDWSDGHLMGLAVSLPSDAVEEEAGLFRALESVTAKQQAGKPHHNECRDFSISLPRQRLWRVTRQPQSAAASLKPERYFRASKVWATVTPIVLDRHLRAKGNAWRQAEMAQLISEACALIDLPRPLAVVPSATSAIRGCPPAKRARGEPFWMDWALTEPLKSRTLTHAVVRFSSPVEGPVALGAGRFFGLGLCLPIDRELHA